MKQIALCLLMLSLLSTRLSAQVTITLQDIMTYFTEGSSYTVNSDTITSSVNIGDSGIFNISFAGHVFNLTSASTSVSAAATGYGNTFANSTIAVKSNQTTPEGTIDVWAFYSIEPNEVRVHGHASKLSISGFDMEVIGIFSPYSVATKLPLTNMDAWTEDFYDTSKTYFGGMETSQLVTHTTAIHTVDGYGTVITPDNRTIDVLKIQIDRRTYSSVGGYQREIEYSFLSKTGESFNVAAADTLQPTSGTIQTSGFSWTNRIATGIADNISAVDEYTLFKNYPNPFNPSTLISYYLPYESKITLTVFNSLGEMVKELASATESIGIHEVNFNASALSSGIYIYRLNAAATNGNKTFISSGKMLLVK